MKKKYKKVECEILLLLLDVLLTSGEGDYSGSDVYDDNYDEDGWTDFH